MDLEVKVKLLLNDYLILYLVKFVNFYFLLNIKIFNHSFKSPLLNLSQLAKHDQHTKTRMLP